MDEVGGRLVECRSDSDYAERPVALYWQGERLEVSQIIARWRTPEGRYFQVCVEGAMFFELFYNELQDTWSIIQG
jgi:hypothetical protein